MAQPPLLMLQDASLTFGGTPLLEAATLSVAAGERIALVGRNGSGKSTLLKIAAGLVEADAVRRFVQPGVTMRYLAQEPDLSRYATVGAYVESGLAPGDDPHAARRTLDALSLNPEKAPQPLSGGEVRRAALAHALAPDPDILLLDEPTNHLDIAAIGWLEAFLLERRKALVLISHDRRLLTTLSTATVWIDRARTHRMEQGFGQFEDWRDGILAAEDEERRRLHKKIEGEKDWLRYGVTARRKRNMGRLRKLEAMRKEQREARQRTGVAKLAVADATRSAKRLIVAEGVSKAFDGQTVVSDLSITVMRGDRLGIVGPNGVGKTTLVNLLLQRLPPDSGTVRFGADIAAHMIDQTREGLDPTRPLRQAINPSGGDQITIGGTTKHVAGYLRDFLFLPEQFNTPVGALSGGERARVLLGRTFATPGNVLVLDEPTNDLDLETLDLLAEVVAEYDGTVILVSHDRDFLDRTVTSTLVAEGGGRFVEFAGGYSDMLAQRGVEPVPTVSSPKRAPKAKAAAGKDDADAAARPRPKKLSFKEKHDLETLPQRLDTLEREIAALGEALSDPELYGKDAKRFAELTEALSARQSERDAAEERWLELEMKREELEAG
ncbi:MAG: ATP-binding cassette domain-containing protein [Pseudomonadota bacterium]